MKRHCIKSFVITIYFTVFALDVSAYNISGRIIDETNNNALLGAKVTLMKDSIHILSQSKTDDKGLFKFSSIKIPDVIIKISYLGYKTKYTIISNNNNDIDLGTITLKQDGITLNEVTVTSSRVIEKADRYIILPSKQEISRSAETLGLLSELKVKMPGLIINEMLKTITIDGNIPIFQINSKEQPLSKILTLNQNNILRIEYRNSPDIRYADRGASGIINFIMKPSQEGGDFFEQQSSSVTTFRNNAQVCASYYHKKSEWTFGYDNILRNSNKQYTNINEEFIGREEPIIRQQKGLPSTTKDFDNNFSLDYTYMHDMNTMLSATFSLRYHNIKDKANNNVTEIMNGISSIYEKYYNNHSESTKPLLNIYFHKTIKDKQSIEINGVGSTSNGNYSRGMDYTTDFNQENRTNNKSWVAGGEVLYAISFKNMTTKFGINYTHNYAQNGYSENGNNIITDKLKKDNVYLYSNMIGNWKKTSYTIGIGAKYFHSADMSISKSYFRPKAIVTINYPLYKHWNINYLFMYDPSLPSLSSFSEVVQTIDDISIQMGNIGIKPSIWTRNRISLNYNIGNFYAAGQASYSHTKDPIIWSYQYISDKTNPYFNKFMRRIENGNYDKRVNLELNLGYQNLFQHITISTTAGWDKYNISGLEYSGKDSHIYISTSLNAYWGNWTAFANYTISPQYNLDGVTFCSNPRYNYIGVKYNLKRWNFGCSAINPFTKKGFYQKARTISRINPSSTEYYIKDFANMVELSIKYRINFGKTLKKANRSLQNTGLDTGVNIDY